MNPAEIEELMHLIRWIRANFDVTILLIEHQMDVVMGCASGSRCSTSARPSPRGTRAIERPGCRPTSAEVTA